MNISPVYFLLRTLLKISFRVLVEREKFEWRNLLINSLQIFENLSAGGDVIE